MKKQDNISVNGIIFLSVLLIIFAFIIMDNYSNINDLERKQQIIYDGLCEDEINLTLFYECLGLFPAPERSLERIWVGCEIKSTKQKCPKTIE